MDLTDLTHRLMKTFKSVGCNVTTLLNNNPQDDCELKIKHVMNMHLKVTREIPLTKVERLWNGPSLRGVKPILVCFQLFKDKEEVLRKSNMLLKARVVSWHLKY